MCKLYTCLLSLFYCESVDNCTLLLLGMFSWACILYNMKQAVSKLVIIKKAEIKFHISVLHTCIIKEMHLISTQTKYLIFVDREGHLNYLFFFDKLGFQPITLCFVLLNKKAV